MMKIINVIINIISLVILPLSMPSVKDIPSTVKDDGICMQVFLRPMKSKIM